MNPERWQQVKQLLDHAIAFNASDRGSFLDRACHGDSELRGEVESLLFSHDRAGSGFLREPVLNLSANTAAAAAPARERRIGAYQLAEEIGRGGMGEVYRAVRVDGQYNKEVAIKFVRGGFESSSLMERFRNERQILASLDHPNIGRLLDGGATPDGIPYLVMELIEGISIDRYCDDHDLSITERLQLFRQVCEAVQYAHQRMVIHRDIKPSNILVTKDSVPKLLDFGIAKLLDPSATAGTTLARPMTPEYASPEQIRGELVTTGTDVYSLGVVLYQLLTGYSPYQGDTSTPHGLARAICEEDPRRPSTVVFRREESREAPSTSGRISNTRKDSAAKLHRRLRGDLDNIVLMALRKDAAQRYASVERLSEDIRRHLDHIPVLARKDTLVYRSAKFVRRHKLGVAIACLAFVLVVTGMVVIVRAERRARAEQALAERRFNDVRKLADSLIFEIHDSIRTLPGATAARQLIVQRAQQYLDSLATDAKSDSGLLRELAAAYARLASVQGEVTNANLGNSKEALKNYRRAVELLEAAVAASPGDRDSRRELAETYLELYRSTESGSEARSLLEKATAILEPLSTSYPADPNIQHALAKTHEMWGSFFGATGQLKESQANYEKSLALCSRLAESEPGNHVYQRELAYAHKHLGGTFIMQKQLQPALEHYRAGLAIDEAQLEANPQDASRRYDITFTYSDIGYILGEQGDVDGALNHYRKALAIRKALADADPKDTRARRGMANTYTYIGGLLRTIGQSQESIAAHREALSIRESLSHNDPSNGDKRLDVAKAEENVAEDYVQLAFLPRTSPRERLALCRQTESLLQQALPVLRDQREKLVGNEISYLSAAEEQSGRCTSEISRLTIQSTLK